MEAFLLDNFAEAYGLTYFGSVAAVALWEGLSPRRTLDSPLRVRWFSNIAVTLLDNALLRWLLPFTAIGVALACAEVEFGLLRWVEAPFWLAFVVSVLVLDFGKYALHYALHRVPTLWRLHRMHHTDQDYDFTTGLRFHPLEAVLTISLNLSLIAIIGAPALAVALTELMVVVVAMVSHGNVRMPKAIDAVLRLFIVTPDMHRVHHSTVWRESNSNFGTLFPWWDRALDTYTAQPAAGHKGMHIGLPDYRGVEHLRLGRMLVDPFVTAPRGDNSGDDGVGTEAAQS